MMRDKLVHLFYLTLISVALFFSAASRSSEEVIATGSPIILRGGEFSITIPKGWSVISEVPGQTLLAQSPKSSASEFRRAIQVMTLGGARYLDEVTAIEFNETIARKYGGTTSSISKYQMNNHMNVELSDGRSALLFYSEFEQDQKKYMQAHLLISNAERHFLISYTDAAEHFSNEATTPNLNEAWQAMMSTEIKGATPVRYKIFLQVAGLIGLLLVTLIALGIYRKITVKRYEQEIKSEFAEDLVTAQNKTPRPVSGPQASLYGDPIDQESDQELSHEIESGSVDSAHGLEFSKPPTNLKKPKTGDKVG